MKVLTADNRITFLVYDSMITKQSYNGKALSDLSDVRKNFILDVYSEVRFCSPTLGKFGFVWH